MAAAPTQRKPTFFWQAALILLPVAVLAALGWFSLRQDKILADHDARERAQAVADDVLAKIWNELTAQSADDASRPAFEVDETGNLIFPPPYATVPTPRPFDLAKLNAQQARLWQRLQAAETDATNLEACVQAGKDFIATQPPENFAATATYELGLRLIQLRKYAEAAAAFDRVATEFPEAVGESGLPLQPLAQLKLFEIEPRARWFPLSSINTSGGRPVNSTFGPEFFDVPIQHFISVDSLCSNIVYHPTALTPQLLKKISHRPIPFDEIIDRAKVDSYQIQMGTEQSETRAAIQRWQKLWTEHELSRRLFSLAKSNLPGVFHKSLTLLETPALAGQSGVVVGLFGSGSFTDATGRVVVPHPFWFNFPAGEAHRALTGWQHEHSGVKGVFEKLGQRWLAVPHEVHGTNHTFVCWSESELGGTLTALVENGNRIPEFMGIGVEVAGEKIVTPSSDLRVWRYNYYVSKGAGQAKKEYTDQLATTILASAVKSETGADLLKINVYLTSPAALYQRQQTRAFWFGSLIAVSTGAALIGLLTAWRAFRRQLQLSEMKSNFVASVSHELRAPIAAVRLMAENLERGKIPEPQKQKEYFAFIVQECRRLSSLIENVLDFSRIEQGRKQYELEPTDIVALVEQTVKLMEPCAAEKGVRLDFETFNIQHSTPNLEVNVDGRAIQQALVNLMDNAIKHSPKGETVTVEIKNEKLKIKNDGDDDAINHQPSTINLSVTDHGPGIPAEEQEKIFERFYRLGSELRRETQGVGIGLSLVKHIVAAHGGRVRVQSAVGQGSRFTIELPFPK